MKGSGFATCAIFWWQQNTVASAKPVGFFEFGSPRSAVASVILKVSLESTCSIGYHAGVRLTEGG